MNRIDAQLLRALLTNQEWRRVVILATRFGGQFKARRQGVAHG